MTIPRTLPLPTHAENASFSSSVPGLQVAWDSTSIGAAKTCPRFYEYSIIYGFTPRDMNVHFTFGLAFHEALEQADKVLALGGTHEDATRVATKYAMTTTWDEKKGRAWISGDSNKNRGTLVRSVVWYMEEYKDDPLETVVLKSGRPAVELSCAMPLGWKTEASGEDLILCGHLDKLVKIQSQPYTYILDRKTTKKTLNKWYFDQFNPNNQFSTYTILGKLGLGEPISGLIADAVQVGVEFSRFERRTIPRTPEMDQEWLDDLGEFLTRMEGYALRQHWPMNDKACYNCAFQGICARTPSTREQWLKTEYTRRVWNPLQVRGDV